MIVKKVKSNNNKPKYWQIGDLVDYIRSPQDRDPGEKVEYAGGRNFFTGTHGGQKLEMISLATKSVHSKMPVSHWVFSWQACEQPSRQNVDELVDVFLEEMGLVGHQVVYGLHHNTEHYHVHIAVNRMNEATGKVVLPHNGFDIEAAHRVVAIVEARQKWQPETNARYEVLPDGQVARKRRGQKSGQSLDNEVVNEPVKIGDKARQFEQRTGQKSGQTIGKEKVLPVIQKATSWAELHQKLAMLGMRFEKKGSGAVIHVGDTVVKASTIDRSISLSKLCKRLGEFEPGEYRELVTVEPEPVADIVDQGLVADWQEYQKERASQDTAPARQAEAEAVVANQKEMAELVAKQREKRQRHIYNLKRHGLSLLNIARHCIKRKHQEERRALRVAQRLKRGRRRRPAFEDWLRIKGRHRQADIWRTRVARRPILQVPERPAPNPEVTIKETPKVTQSATPPPLTELELFNQYAKAVDADRYRVTSIKMYPNGDKQVFILDKKDGQTKGFTPEEMARRMAEMIRLQKRGENLYYTPLSADKHHILIDDMTAENLNRLQQDGFCPAVILESSPGNFQCILTIKKLKTEFDRDVGNRITERLNKEYGDPKLSGCIHPHRAPGFDNRKPKHRRQDGSYPQVKLLFTEKRLCQKAFEMTWAISKEYVEAAKKRVAHKPQRVQGTFRPGDPIAAYYAHYDNIKANLAVEDYSRVDAMIAVRMRATNHSYEDVVSAIRQCAPTIRAGKAGRNWQRYAERTANYAFGAAGDAVMDRYSEYFGKWQNIENSREKHLYHGMQNRIS